MEITVLRSEVKTQPTDLYLRSNLTRLQILYWVGQSMRRETPVFNTIYTYTVKGAVERERFGQAFAGMVLESDALRMVVEEERGVPQQRDTGGVPKGMEYVDMSGEGDVAGAYGAWLGERKGRVLELGESVYDTALVKLGEERYVWYLNVHHILVDASSFVEIYRRVAERYAGRGWAEWPQYREYVAYERGYRRSRQYERAQAYWEKKMAVGPEVLRVRGKVPEKRSTRVKRESVRLGTERSEGLRMAARQEGVYTVSEELSQYNLFGGLFFVELAGLSGNERLGVVTPVHNRFTEGFRQTVGLLLEFCPLQVAVSGSDTLEGVVRKMRQETRETLGYYQYGSGMALQSQAYDVMYNTYREPRLELGGKEVGAERVHAGHGSESLALHVTDVEAQGEFVLHFDFHEDVFSEGEREQVKGEYLRLLDAYLENPQQSVEKNINQVYEPSKTVTLPGTNGRDTKELVLERSGGQVYVAPRNDLEIRLAEVWEEILGVEPIGIRDNFFDIGGSSWLAVKLFARIQEVIGRELPLTILFQAGTIEQLVKEILDNETPGYWSPLVPIRSAGSRRPFFCVHGAGGHVLFIASLVRYLVHDQPIYAFQARGIQANQEPLTYVEEMASLYLKALRQVQPNGPYLLGGYSMGGMVAFEMAQQLVAQGERVDALVIIDTPAQNPRFKYLWDLTTWITSVLNMNQSMRDEAFLSVRNYFFRMRYFLRLSLAEKAAYLFRRGSAIGDRIAGTISQIIGGEEVGTDSDIDQLVDVDINRIRKLFEVNERAFRLYIPQKYPADMILFQSSEGYQDVDKNYSHIPNLGWDSIIGGKIENHIIPGDHNAIIREPRVRLLGEYMRRVLENAQRK